MKRFGAGSIARLVLAGLMIASVSVGFAQSTAHLEKHARKIHHKLAKYQTGSYLHLVLGDDTDAYGALGTLADASFTFTSADSNTTSTYSYNDIEKVKTDKERIGHGAEPRRHIRHLVPIVICVAAVGAAGAVYLAER